MVKNDDVLLMHNLQVKHRTHFNTHTRSSMWFDFESVDDAINFFCGVSKKLRYLNLTMGLCK